MVVVFNHEEGVRLCAERVSAQQVVTPTVLLVVTEVERHTVVPPVVPPALSCDELLIGTWLEVHELAVEGATRACDADTCWSCIDLCDSDPGKSQVPAGVIDANLSVDPISLDAHPTGFGVVDAGEVEQEENSHDPRADREEDTSHWFVEGVGSEAAAEGTVGRLGATGVDTATVSSFNSLITVRKGKSCGFFPYA